MEQLTAANLGGLQEGGGAGAAPVVEEELTAATVGWPGRKGHELLGGGGAANRSDLGGPAGGGRRRGRSCSRGGGAANCSNLGRPAVGGARAAPGVEEQLTAATLGGLREEKRELLQGWRSR